MDYAKHLFAKAAELRALADAAEDDVIYDELVVAANVCEQAASIIELHNKTLAA